MEFDIYKYMDDLCSQNKLAAENQFKFCRVSGISGLQEVIADMRSNQNFVAADDFADGKIYQSASGYFTRYVFMIYIFARYDVKDVKDQIEKLNVCRKLREQIFSRFLVDRDRIDDLRYLDVNECLFREMEGAFLNNCTGMYFQFTIDVPTNLCYDRNQWIR